MIPELGQLCLILALCLASCQTFFSLTGAHRRQEGLMAVGPAAAAGQFVFVSGAFGLLAWSFWHNDFSLLYVASNSNSKLPDMYRLAAVWGGHEGSLLLWALVLGGWTLAVTALSGALPREISARIIGVMGAVSIGFLAFILFTSNPFLRLDVVPFDGNDLNPLLQDPAMALHPPMLYIGYVGFSVAFAFAVAALLSGRVDQAWARWARPWTTAAWVFLTIGIALGSWWAYYELGWGGWWFWDPVENASFMPWLVGTALMHSLAVTEKRGLFKGSTLLLAIAAFSLSLVGTFLVRSGVLVSVHSFAADPARGIFILTFLAVVIGTALSLYAWRAPSLDQPVGFKPFSRESFLLINNILLCIAAGLILLGTLYPLVLEAMDAGKISVGPPYFETAFMIPMLPLLLALGVGMHTAWRSATVADVGRKLRGAALLALGLGILVPLLVYGGISALTAVGAAAGSWVVITAILDPLRQLAGRGPKLTQAALGMSVAHLGVGLFVLGVTVTSSFGLETDQRIVPGETARVGDYEIVFRRTEPVTGPNYRGLRGEVTVLRGGQPVTTLYPEKRTYDVRTSAMTEAGIDAGWSRDIFVALGDELGNGAWSIRLQYKPLIRFIWLGTIVMAIGGLIAGTDRRYRLRARAEALAAGTQPAQP
ncbi:MAG: heme lyase CcmF/NrfE family subunit [Gammaproteobacteria bacterium]|nr:heme lyase CcmF/NrfE family subunit [Gammaproteobacteria bacterium]MDH5275343.1 heme lyase CcmF/NrfE family subunit [Gammaproteobacteria bacterium]